MHAFAQLRPRQLTKARTLLFAVLLAAILSTATVQGAFAYGGQNPGSCSALTPSGSYPSGFGGQLGTWNDGTHTIVACSDGYLGYVSNKYNYYGMAFQCAELIQRYANDHWGDAPSAWKGNASQFWFSGYHPSRFTAYLNGSTYMPAVGDIMVWGPESNGNPVNSSTIEGHVAIIKSIAVSGTTTWTITTFEQNYSYNGTTLVSSTTETMTRYNHYYSISSYDHIIYQSSYYGVLHG